MEQKKIYVITENFIFANNQKWICDVLTDEFINYSKINITKNIDEADVIWILQKNDNIYNLKKNGKKIITTIHHIPPKEEKRKYTEFIKYMKFLEEITDYYHVICDKVEIDIKMFTSKKVIKANFWINESMYFFIKDKNNIKEKYNLPLDKMLIGSFQRDCDGNENSLKPKYSKGPDIFINILKDIKNDSNIHVILTGRMRKYVIANLEENKINYSYFEMVPQIILNELYNCLDLYIVSSRIEGGPRSIMECGLTKTPIISTDVGIAKLILPDINIYDVNDYMTYKQANPYQNIEQIYKNTENFSIEKYMEKFVRTIFTNI